MAHYLFFSHRRILFCVLVFYVSNHQIFQLLGLMFLNKVFLIYIGGVRPMSTRLMNRIALVNEFLVTIATIHVLFFTDWVPDLEV